MISGGVDKTGLESLLRSEDLRAELKIPETLQQALSNVSEAAEQANSGFGAVLSGQLLQQAAHLEHLQDQNVQTALEDQGFTESTL